VYSETATNTSPHEIAPPLSRFATTILSKKKQSKKLFVIKGFASESQALILTGAN
jgi:hypothetical protein